MGMPTLVPTTARGRLRPSPATVMAVVMAMVATAVATTARGRLRPSPAMVMDVAMEAMAAATAGTTVELRSKRSELSLCEDRSVFHENSMQKIFKKKIHPKKKNPKKKKKKKKKKS